MLFNMLHLFVHDPLGGLGLRKALANSKTDGLAYQVNSHFSSPIAEVLSGTNIGRNFLVATSGLYFRVWIVCSRSLKTMWKRHWNLPIRQWWPIIYERDLPIWNTILQCYHHVRWPTSRRLQWKVTQWRFSQIMLMTRQCIIILWELICMCLKTPPPPPFRPVECQPRACEGCTSWLDSDVSFPFGPLQWCIETQLHCDYKI